MKLRGWCLPAENGYAQLFASGVSLVQVATQPMN
jgi:hypothetical protein